MNTGHNGSMTTIHANSPKDMITRLETMLLLSGNNLDPSTSQRIIATSVDLIVQLEKTVNGNRILSRISEVLHQKGGPGKEIKLEIRDIAVFDGGIKNRWIFYDHIPTFLEERR
ncbi:ATPase, T2SS/T4P/T4SS family [Actinomycetota bacterium]